MVEKPELVEEPQIEVQYEGILADKLQWNQDKLDQFCEIADLRSWVTIYDDGRRPDNQYENLGETMAFKNVVIPSKLLRKEVLNPSFRFAADFPEANAYIYLHDQIIAQKVLDKTGGKLDEELFAQEVNLAVKSSLAQLLAAEKRLQLSWDLLFRIKAPNLLFSDVAALFGIGMSTMIFYDLAEEVIKSGASTYTAISSLATFAILYATHTMFKGMSDKYRLLTEENEKTEPMFTYFGSLSDLYPFPHLAGYLKGNHYLLTQGSDFVTLK